MVLADGSVREFDAGHDWFGAVKLGLGMLGVVTQVTLRTVVSPVYVCQKNVTSADSLETDLLTWNHENALSKAWWFPDENVVHVWTAQEADAAETERYREHGSVLLEQTTTSDVLNSTVDKTLVHMRGDTKILDEHGKPFQTVTRFKDFSDVTGDVYQVFCRGIATPQINVEIGVPLARAGEVVAAIKRWHAETRPHMHYPVILRATGASDSWLSPSYGDGDLLLRLRRLLRRGRVAGAGGRGLPAGRRARAGRRGRAPALGQVLRRVAVRLVGAATRGGPRSAGVRAALDPHRRFENTFTAALFA